MATPDTQEPTSSPAARDKRSWLDVIESIGNKVPHPAMIFLGLCVLVIVLSAVLAAFDVKVTYEVAQPPPVPVTQDYETGSSVPDYRLPPPDYRPDGGAVTQETTAIKSLLSVDGVRFLFTSFVSNFSSFSVVAVILVAMLGVGVAEEAGLMAALIRKLVKVAPAWAISWIIVFIGVISSIASDAGYLILIPLAAAAYLSVGRHPLAGLAAAYAGVSAAFGVNVLIKPSDGILTEVTNEAIALVDPNLKIGITANLWFNIVSTFFLTAVIVFVSSRLVEKRLGVYDPAEGAADPGGAGTATSPEVEAQHEARGLRFAGYAVLASIVVVVLLSAPPGAPLRNPVTGSLVNEAPLMESLIVIITLIFLAAGIGYGYGARSLTGSTAVINAITKTWASLAGLLFMLFLIAQFIAYFNYSNMPTVISVAMADVLEQANIGPVWLLIGFVLVIAVLDIIIPGLLPKWAIFAPVFIPLFVRLGVAPQTLLAAYRLGDSPMNVITPLMVYLPFIVLVAQRYKKTAGLGTIIALMIPYAVIVLVAWLVFFIAWFLLGIPLGPGYPVNL